MPESFFANQFSIKCRQDYALAMGITNTWTIGWSAKCGISTIPKFYGIDPITGGEPLTSVVPRRWLSNAQFYT